MSREQIDLNLRVGMFKTVYKQVQTAFPISIVITVSQPFTTTNLKSRASDTVYPIHVYR